MATSETKFSPSKKRYDKQALDRHNSDKEFGCMFYLNSAAECRETMELRRSWILSGEGHWFGSYFKWRERYRRHLKLSKAERLTSGQTLPLPG